MQSLDLANKRFGWLVFLAPTDKRNSERTVMWNCICDCGVKCLRTVSYLGRAAIPSCGCQRYNKAAPNRMSMESKVFGSLTVLRLYSKSKGILYWECVCVCGVKHVALGAKLRNGEIKSCGCRRWRKKHGLCGTRIYQIWQGMKERCLNPNAPEYHNYGGRGITIYPEWLNVQKFFEYMGHPPDSHSIDRYPNKNGNYEPGNVRWATPAEQSANKRNNRRITAFSQTKIAQEWSKVYGIPHWTITSRLNHKWQEEHAVSWPIRKVKYKTRLAEIQS